MPTVDAGGGASAATADASFAAERAGFALSCPQRLCSSRRAKCPGGHGRAIGASQYPRCRIPGALAVRAGRQIPGGPEVLAPRRGNRLAAKAEHVQRAKAMAKLRFCGCGHVILHSGQSKRALAALMPASRPALYTKLKARTTTVAIIATDGPIRRTKSRSLQSAVIVGLQCGHWSGAESKTVHATVQTRVVVSRGRRPTFRRPRDARSVRWPWQSRPASG